METGLLGRINVRTRVMALGGKGKVKIPIHSRAGGRVYQKQSALLPPEQQDGGRNADEFDIGRRKPC